MNKMKGGYCMSLTDFEFNERRVSELGCMVCTFNTVGLETVDMGSNLSLTTIKRQNYFHTVSTKYEEPFTTKIQICKYGCNNQKEHYFEDKFVVYLMKWLLSKKNRKFKMIYDDIDMKKCYNMYYIGTFTNVHALKVGENILGLELTFTANAPFGFYEPLEFCMEFPDVDTEFCIYDSSNEEGYIYPSKVEIMVLEDGDLEICNSMETKRTIIKNCIAGETITLDGTNKIIQSDATHPCLYNDFNYTFIRIINKCGHGMNSDVRKNVFTVSLPCNIYLKYSPICKMGVI